MKSYNVCIVGGGSTYTLGFLKSFVRLREEFPLKKLVLFDIDAERQEPSVSRSLTSPTRPTSRKHTREWISYSCR